MSESDCKRFNEGTALAACLPCGVASYSANVDDPLFSTGQQETVPPVKDCAHGTACRKRMKEVTRGGIEYHNVMVTVTHDKATVRPTRQSV
jgi:hypothetical protein